MAHGRRYHEPGVGGRTGISVGDGALDLDAFFQAGRRALGGPRGSEAARTHRISSVASRTVDADVDSDDDPGLARSAVATSPVPVSDSSRVSMDIEQSPAPSPRTTLCHLVDENDPAILDSGVLTRESPSDVSLGKRHLASTPRHRAKRNGSSLHSMTLNETATTGTTEEIGPSSPSPVLDRRKAFTTGLTAGLEARRQARIQQTNADEGKEAGWDLQSLASTSMGAPEETDMASVGASDNEQCSREDNRSEEETQALPSPLPVAKRAFNIATSDAEKTSGNANKLSKTMNKAPLRRILHEVNGSARAAPRVNLRQVQRKPTTREQDGKVIERVPSSYQRLAGMHHSEDEEGGEVRRSTRYRYKPLEYWRGETVRYGRPSLPSSSSSKDVQGATLRQHAGVDVDDTIDADMFEDAMLAVPPPVAVLKAIIRIPRAEGEGTFSGLKARPKSKPDLGADDGTEKTKTAGKKRAAKDRGETDPAAPTRHVEDGWDKDTPSRAIVFDVTRSEEVEREVARTATQMRPRMAAGCSFGFEKVFVVDDFMATGVLFLLVNGSKPVKNSKDNFYTFTVLEGCVRVTLNGTPLVIAPQGMVFIPSGNDYSIENMAQRVARLAFTQCKRPR